jgi:hypothetical protein
MVIELDRTKGKFGTSPDDECEVAGVPDAGLSGQSIGEPATA